MTVARLLIQLQDISTTRNILQLGINSGLVLTAYLVWASRKQQNRLQIETMDSKDNTSIVHITQVLSESAISQIASSYGGSVPEGNFCKGRHGYTHYVLDQPPLDSPVPVNDKYGDLIVMAHGLGNSLTAYKDLSKHMTAKGYYVLRYDYFGHGYSKYDGDDMWMEYTTDMLIDQLEDVVDHVVNTTSSKHKLKLSTFVGHSTGGVLGIAASARWSESASSNNIRQFPRIVLLSPAIWADKVRCFIVRLL